MIHAGAKAGVYELKDMAFESVEGFLRAGACSKYARRVSVEHVANGYGQA